MIRIMLGASLKAPRHESKLRGWALEMSTWHMRLMMIFAVDPQEAMRSVGHILHRWDRLVAYHGVFVFRFSNIVPAAVLRNFRILKQPILKSRDVSAAGKRAALPLA